MLLSAVLIVAAQEQIAPFSVDLFLIGSNPKPVTNPSWPGTAKFQQDSAIEAVLRPLVEPLVKEKKSFFIIDGGDGSLFPSAQQQVGCMVRRYSGYDSMTETVESKGKSKTKVVEHSETEETTTGAFGVQPNGKQGYLSQNFVHFGSGNVHPIVALMDLNSYRSTLASNQEQDRKALPNAVLLSNDSLRATKQYLANSKTSVNVPVLCRTGIPRASDGMITAFPPEGVVGHYRLIQGNDGWKLSFIEFVR